MRRKLAYIILSASLLIAGAATFGEALLNIDTDVTYGAGRELVFKISERDTTYGGIDPDNYIVDDGYTAVNAVGDEIENRLETWGIPSTVTKEGYDTVRVTIRSQSADETEYSYLQRYLSFSGDNITVTVGSTDDEVVSGAPSNDMFLNGALFEGIDQPADIRYVNGIPVVTLGIKEDAQGENGPLNELVEYCADHTKAADSSAGTEATTCYLVFWGNYQEGDSFKDATDTESATYDPNMTNRIVFGTDVSNIWYDDSNDDHDYTRLQLIPNSSALENGQFDANKAGAAYKAAYFYMCMFNANSYHTINDIGYDVNFTYATDIPATAEDLVTAGAWHLTPALSRTLLAGVIAFVTSIIVLSCFYKLGSLAIASNAMLSMLFSLLLYGYFAAQFGVGTLAALMITMLMSFFGTAYYFSKFKEQIYEGRNAKKAHQEAIKKAFWPTLDVSIVAILIGICVYSLVPTVVGQMGLLLVLGGFFSGAINILLLRLQGYLLANDNDTMNKLNKLYGIDLSKVPNLLKEEKQTYFGPFADEKSKKTLKKGWLPVSITGAVLLIASIIGISTFSSLNGTPFNYGDVYHDTTSISLEYRVEEGTEQTLALDTVNKVQENYLSLIELDGKPLTKDDYGDISLEEATIYMTQDERNYDVYYFEVPLNQYYDEQATYNFVVDGHNYSTLAEAAQAAAEALVDTGLTVRVQNVDVEPGLPALSSVYLGLGVGLLATTIYLILRFKLARGFLLGVISLGGSLLPLGFFALTRIPVTPIVALSSVAVAFLTIVIGLFIFNKEKELTKESRERNKKTREFKEMMLERSLGESLGDILIYLLPVFFTFVYYFGFVPQLFQMSFLGIIIGLLLSVVILLFTIIPLTLYTTHGLSKIHISFKQGTKKEEVKKNSSEPEEAIFIGIND